MNGHFQPLLGEFKELMGRMKKVPSGVPKTPEWPVLQPDAPVALGFWAHPDDEVLTGGAMAIRLRRAGYRVVNVAMTQGEPHQVERRHRELEAACQHLGMELLIPNYGNAFHGAVRRAQTQLDWPVVDEIAKIIADHKPNIIMVHHDEDEHLDHVGVNYLVHAALRQTVFNLKCVLIEGEFWRDMRSPNLQLEVSDDDLALLMEATVLHKGEVERNAYHAYLVLLAYLNAQFGEVVTGWGDDSAPFDTSFMYRLRWVYNGKIISSFNPRQLDAETAFESLFD